VPIELPPAWIALLNAGGCLIIQLGLAWAFTLMPARWFDAPLQPATGNRRWYEHRLGIRRWKDRLPDGAKWLGGFAKGSLGRSDPAHLQAFIRETRRGECCHWLVLACTPVFFLWNPWWADAIMIAYALAANAPCILVQRYNRIRLSRACRRPAFAAE
jgi:glycosyl-4,4'-diaponeurosporenoate acyltransferase